MHRGIMYYILADVLFTCFKKFKLRTLFYDVCFKVQMNKVKIL